MRIPNSTIIVGTGALLLVLFGASSVVTKDDEPAVIGGPIASCKELPRKLDDDPGDRLHKVLEDIDDEFSRIADDCDKLRQALNDTDKKIAEKEDELSAPEKLKNCEAKLREANLKLNKAINLVREKKGEEATKLAKELLAQREELLALKQECDALKQKVKALDDKKKKELQDELKQLKDERDKLAQQLKDCEEAAKEGAKAGPEGGVVVGAPCNEGETRNEQKNGPYKFYSTLPGATTTSNLYKDGDKAKAIVAIAKYGELRLDIIIGPVTVIEATCVSVEVCKDKTWTTQKSVQQSAPQQTYYRDSETIKAGQYGSEQVERTDNPGYLDPAKVNAWVAAMITKHQAIAASGPADLAAFVASCK